MKTLLRVLPRYSLAGVMGVAASYKVLHVGDFGQVVRSVWPLGMLPGWTCAAVAGAITGLEVLVVVMLFRRKSAFQGGVLATSLLLVFTIVTLLNYTRISGGCGCMWQMAGIIPVSGVALVVRNAVLILLAATVAWMARGAVGVSARNAAT